METIGERKVKVNVGNLLENQLEKWKGGGHHARGLAEYISNSDDSYRRLEKFQGQSINVTIKSRRGTTIDELIIEDFGEGMSFEDLENKFFQYFESFAGRDRGFKVTGRFGTGGKAYAIMNFRRCWIISVKDGLECRAWFKWDLRKKEILNGYDSLGYKDKKTNKPNGTKIILEDSYKVNHPLDELISRLENSTRIRHVLKTQKPKIRIERKGEIKEIELKYNGPKESDAKDKWEFEIPKSLMNSDEDTKLTLRYFENALGEHSFIDLSDGISSVADLEVSKFDGRPYSKYINGSLTLTKLIDSPAVKENRKGLEEGDDMTFEIENFIKEKVTEVINKVESITRDREKERENSFSKSKLKELSKFLSKQDLKFKLELKELQKRFSILDNEFTIENDDDSISNENDVLYRKPLPEDSNDDLIKGRWIEREEFVSTSDVQVVNPNPILVPEFIPDIDGDDFAVIVGTRKKANAKEKKKKKGIDVLMSNNPTNEVNINFSPNDEPVSDRDLYQQGIIWINSVNPIIVKAIERKDNSTLLNDMIANYVFLIVAQFHAQKEFESQPEDERGDPFQIFRKHFFNLQKSIRHDSDVKYFED